jgi:hypothetical protein
VARESPIGAFTVAFRLDAQQQLIAFAGHDSTITLNNQTWSFADHPLSIAAWAPITENRRVPGGASMELWIGGTARLRIPLPKNIRGGELFFQGAQPGVLGARVPSKVSEGVLEFEAKDWNSQRLYFVDTI